MYEYPKEACRGLEQALERIEADSGAAQAFQELLECYAKDKTCDFEELIRRMEEISGRAGIHAYTGYLLLFLNMSQTLRAYYRAAGVDEEIWFTSMNDLKWKLDECQCVYGVWGTFVPSWYEGFFQMTRFGFGKLQFEQCRFNAHYEKDGLALEPDSPVINVHIPRTGTRLDRKSMRESYQMAATFYRNGWGDRPMAFVCESWLLFGPNRKVLSPQSNLYAFLSDYEIIDQGEYEDYSEVWRLFDQNYNGDVEQLPQNTSLRRAYADWIRRGRKTGWGYGVFVYSR